MLPWKIEITSKFNDKYIFRSKNSLQNIALKKYLISKIVNTTLYVPDICRTFLHISKLYNVLVVKNYNRNEICIYIYSLMWQCYALFTMNPVKMYYCIFVHYYIMNIRHK